MGTAAVIEVEVNGVVQPVKVREVRDRSAEIIHMGMRCEMDGDSARKCRFGLKDDRLLKVGDFAAPKIPLIEGFAKTFLLYRVPLHHLQETASSIRVQDLEIAEELSVRFTE